MILRAIFLVVIILTISVNVYAVNDNRHDNLVTVKGGYVIGNRYSFKLDNYKGSFAQTTGFQAGVMYERYFWERVGVAVEYAYMQRDESGRKVNNALIDQHGKGKLTHKSHVLSVMGMYRWPWKKKIEAYVGLGPSFSYTDTKMTLTPASGSDKSKKSSKSGVGFTALLGGRMDIMKSFVIGPSVEYKYIYIDNKDLGAFVFNLNMSYQF